MNTRTFGVEIECGYEGGYDPEPPDCICDEYEDEHCEACCGCWNDGDRSTGCEVATDLLSSSGFDHWLDGIHSDGSGVEIPSPILRGREGLHELRQVMRLLSDNGFYTGLDDGMHVHHGAEEWEQDAALTVHTVELWEENDELIRQFVAPERRDTNWAKSRAASPECSNWEAFKTSKSLGDLSNDRYYALNVQGVRENSCANPRGTIEFRLHQGTLDFEKAAAWIHFGQSFLEFAKRTYKRGEIVTCASAIDLLRQSRTSPKSKRTLLVKAAA